MGRNKRDNNSRSGNQFNNSNLDDSRSRHSRCHRDHNTDRLFAAATQKGVTVNPLPHQ